VFVLKVIRELLADQCIPAELHLTFLLEIVTMTFGLDKFALELLLFEASVIYLRLLSSHCTTRNAQILAMLANYEV
jgi:hypothetical protein